METKTIYIKAHNYPEAEDILKQKFVVSNILNKERKFLEFENTNFVYRYKLVVVVRKQIPICSNCKFPIRGKVAWYNCKKVCQYCYRTLTRGYYK